MKLLHSVYVIFWKVPYIPIANLFAGQKPQTCHKRETRGITAWNSKFSLKNRACFISIPCGDWLCNITVTLCKFGSKRVSNCISQIACHTRDGSLTWRWHVNGLLAIGNFPFLEKQRIQFLKSTDPLLLSFPSPTPLWFGSFISHAPG